jgi:hypothetical protein
MSGYCEEHKMVIPEFGICWKCEQTKPEEINRLIAEKIMGWKYDYSELGKGATIKFNPYENIADAWLVVEKMAEKLIDFNIYIDAISKLYICDFLTEKVYRVEDSSAPKAICLAALKTLEGK